MKRIKVLLVDDSILFRKMVSTKLESDRIEVVTAVDADDAMKMIQQENPQVVTLDVEMPKMNGIDFLRKMMVHHPLPAIVVTSLPMRAFDALEAGAVDFVRKPSADSAEMDRFISELQMKINIASVCHITKKSVLPRATNLSKMAALTNGSTENVIAIGASTGGTEAILEVIKNLPSTTPGIVIVQHMPPVFTKLYAQRMDKLCKMRVKEAENNDRVCNGQVLIAAGEYHMRLMKDFKGFYVKCEMGEKVSGHCPSVDVLFESVALSAKEHAIGVILTGMGADGAKSMLKMKNAGAYTIGQDEASCVVYGMPHVAFTLGGVKKQLPLDQIASDIISSLNAMKR